MDLELEFDERAVLMENLVYLTNSLEVRSTFLRDIRNKTGVEEVFSQARTFHRTYIVVQ